MIIAYDAVKTLTISRSTTAQVNVREEMGIFTNNVSSAFLRVYNS